MAGYLRGSNANLGGAFVTSRGVRRGRTTRARQAGADFTGSRPEEIAFGANMTTLNFLLAHAVGADAGGGRRDRRHAARPRRRTCRRGCGSRTTTSSRCTRCRCARTTRTLDLDALEALLTATGRGSSPSRSRRTPSARSPTRAASPTPRTPSARWPGPTPSTTRRTAASTATALGLDVRALLAVQVLRPAPRHGRDPPRPGRALAGRPGAPGRRDARGPPLRDGHASRTRRWPASSRPSTTWPSLGERRRPGGERLDSAPSRASRAHEESLSVHALRASARSPACRLYGIADPARVAERTPTFAFTLDGARPRDVAAELGPRGHLHWDGNYYALGVDARARPRGARRRRARRLPALHDGGGGRPALRPRRGDRDARLAAAALACVTIDPRTRMWRNW